jgi:asparagine synthetase B (glutamine-hydrolysing)
MGFVRYQVSLHELEKAIEQANVRGWIHRLPFVSWYRVTCPTFLGTTTTTTRSSSRPPPVPYDPLALRKAFEKAVVKRLMADVPFGVLLSGGLDSSLVAAVAVRHLAETEAARRGGTKLHSFCVGLEGSPNLKAAR